MDPAAFFCPEACQRLPMFARVFKRLSVSAEGAGAASPDGEDVAGAVPESEGDEAVPVPEPPEVAGGVGGGQQQGVFPQSFFRFSSNRGGPSSRGLISRSRRLPDTKSMHTESSGGIRLPLGTTALPLWENRYWE